MPKMYTVALAGTVAEPKRWTGCMIEARSFAEATEKAQSMGVALVDGDYEISVYLMNPSETEWFQAHRELWDGKLFTSIKDMESMARKALAETDETIDELVKELEGLLGKGPPRPKSSGEKN